MNRFMFGSTKSIARAMALGVAVTGVTLQASAGLVSTANPGTTYPVTGQLRNGANGFEAKMVQPTTLALYGGNGIQLNGPGSSAWNNGYWHNFEFTYRAATGTATLKVDFGDGSGLDAVPNGTYEANEIVTYADSVLASYGFKTIQLWLRGASTTREGFVNNLVINGESQGNYSASTSGGIQWWLKDSADGIISDPSNSTGDITITGLFMNELETVSGSQELPAFWMQFGAQTLIASCTDTDGDTVCDDVDNCVNVANPGQENSDGDSLGNVCDNCALVTNADQADADGDDVGNACDVCYGSDNVDADSDGMCDGSDNCPTTANSDQADADGDGDGDLCDNCPGTVNADQANADSDDFGDACDNCPNAANNDQANNDGDSEGDVCDADDDNDGVSDVADNCPIVANADQADYDVDGQGDACDADDDGDTVADSSDACPQTALGANVDINGCSAAQNVAAACPCNQVPAWKNHGQYVSCVAQAATAQVTAGLITETEKGVIVSGAAKTGCGKK